MQVVLDNPQVVSRGVLRGRLVTSGLRLERARVTPVLRVVADGLQWHRSEGEAMAYEGEPRAEIPFEVTALGAPVSYAGQLIQLTYFLEATGEGLDEQGRTVALQASTPFTLSGSEAEPGLLVDLLDEGDPSQVDQRSWGPVVILGAIALIVLAGAGKMLSSGIYGLGAVIAIVGAIPCIFLYLAIGRLRQQGTLGQPQAKVGPRTAAGYRETSAEDEYEVTVWIKPDAAPLRVEAVVAVREEIDRGSGEQRVQKRRDGWRSSQELSASAPGEYRGRLPLPKPGSVPFPYGGIASVNIQWVLLVGVHLSEDDVYWTEAKRLKAEPRRGPGSVADRNAQLARRVS